MDTEIRKVAYRSTESDELHKRHRYFAVAALGVGVCQREIQASKILLWKNRITEHPHTAGVSRPARVGGRMPLRGVVMVSACASKYLSD